MYQQIVPTLTDVEHVFFWALLVVAVALILAFVYYALEVWVPRFEVRYEDTEDRRRQLEKVFPGYFGGRR